MSCIVAVEAGSLPWVAEHLSAQQTMDYTLATLSVFGLLAISSQNWQVNLDHQTVKYDSPMSDYVEVIEYWKSSTGLQWQYRMTLPESEYFEAESIKALKSAQYLQMQYSL